MSDEVNQTAAALLGLLRDGPRSGYALVQDAEAVLGPFWSVTRSQVYRELAGMAERGLVAAQEAGPRDRRPYALTDEGRRVFRDWVHSDPGPEVVRVPLLLRMAFADEVEPGRLAQMVLAQRAAHEQVLAGYLDIREGLREAPVAQQALVGYGIAHEQAIVAWCDEVVDRLR